jgi:hypothetical protein
VGDIRLVVMRSRSVGLPVRNPFTLRLATLIGLLPALWRWVPVICKHRDQPAPAALEPRLMAHSFIDRWLLCWPLQPFASLATNCTTGFTDLRRYGLNYMLRRAFCRCWWLAVG